MKNKQAFITAVENGDAWTVENLLATDETLANELGSDGMSPLHFAATSHIAELLLAHGADINLRDRDHNGTPAQWAMGSRHEVCQYLLEQGAESDIILYCVTGNVNRARAVLQENPTLLDLRIDHKAPKGYSVMPYDSDEIDRVPGGHVYTYKVGPTMPLLEIALQAKQAAIVDMLMEYGYQIKLREWYMIAGQGPRNMDRLVKMFLAKGWDINARQKHRHGMWSPLHWLAQRGLTHGISCLLENGADPDIADDQGRTPMHIIAQKGVGKNQAQLLIEHGGDVSTRDAKGKTPFDYAQKAKKKSVANFLRKYTKLIEKKT